MSPYHRSSSLLKSHLRQSAFYLSLASCIGLTTTACRDSPRYENVTTLEPTKGVISTIEEVEKDSFRIVNEELIDDRSASKVIVRRLDGSSETLDMTQARALINNNDTTFVAARDAVNDNDYADNNGNPTTEQQQQQHYHRPHSLGNSIWWGAMGYMLGRNLNQPVQPSFYRYNSPFYQEKKEEKYTGSGSSSSSGWRGYSSARGLRQSISSSARSVTSSRPISSGRSGFFSGWGRSSGG